MNDDEAIALENASSLEQLVAIVRAYPPNPTSVDVAWQRIFSCALGQ